MSGTESQAALFESLCDEYAGVSGITVPDGGSGFGSNAIKVNKSIFAMLVNDRLVGEAPGRTGRGADLFWRRAAFDAGKGKPMKEWVILTVDDDACRVLVAEAMAFVAG